MTLKSHDEKQFIRGINLIECSFNSIQVQRFWKLPLAKTWVGKETNLSASYWNHDDKMFEKEQNEYL